jgi:hypothetical protein
MSGGVEDVVVVYEMMIADEILGAGDGGPGTLAFRGRVLARATIDRDGVDAVAYVSEVGGIYVVLDGESVHAFAGFEEFEACERGKAPDWFIDEAAESLGYGDAS